jgi:hypothetical protein
MRCGAHSALSRADAGTDDMLVCERERDRLHAPPRASFDRNRKSSRALRAAADRVNEPIERDTPFEESFAIAVEVDRIRQTAENGLSFRPRKSRLSATPC